MARTTRDDVLQPELFTDAVEAAFAQKNVFMGSALVGTGAAVVDGTFGQGAEVVGKEVEVPYFETIGEYQENVADGDPAEIRKIRETSEKATVSRDTLAIESTRWGRNAKGGDAYEEAARQLVVAAQRAMDKRLIAAACNASGGLV